jgi:hypothetical protein
MKATVRDLVSWLAVAGGMLALSTSGCTESAQAARNRDILAEEATRAPEHLIFVYDRSASISGSQLDGAHELMRQRVRALGHGDHIGAIEVLQRSIEEVPRRWSQAVPPREQPDMVLAADSISRARFIRDAVDYLATFADSTDRGGIMGTDLLSTFHDVAAEFQANPDAQRTLYVFSDMLQSTPEIEMEGARRMPPAHWVLQQASQGTLPDLTGVCVVVVGGRIDNGLGQRVKAFWKTYFDATGATLYDRNYAFRPVKLPGSDAC